MSLRNAGTGLGVSPQIGMGTGIFILEFTTAKYSLSKVIIKNRSYVPILSKTPTLAVI
jgi:hypothetical protein